MTAADEAIVLAGGLGTRLRGVVDDLPKALAPVAGRPFLAWLLDALAAQGIRRVVLATGFRAGQIEATVGVAWRGMEIVHSREPASLGTGGALVLAAQRTTRDAFFAVNGDTWVGLDYAAFGAAVAAAGARLGVALARVPDVSRYGAACLAGEFVIGFSEKGAGGQGCINAGAYWLRRDLLDGRPAGVAFSFEREVLVPAASREPVVGYAHTHGFIDIGVPEDYRRAQAMFGGAPASAP